MNLSVLDFQDWPTLTLSYHFISLMAFINLYLVCLLSLLLKYKTRKGTLLLWSSLLGVQCLAAFGIEYVFNILKKGVNEFLPNTHCFFPVLWDMQLWYLLYLFMLFLKD